MSHHQGSLLGDRDVRGARGEQTNTATLLRRPVPAGVRGHHLRTLVVGDLEPGDRRLGLAAGIGTVRP